MFTKRIGRAKKRENLLGRGLTKRKAAYSTKSDCNRASVAMTCEKNLVSKGYPSKNELDRWEKQDQTYLNRLPNFQYSPTLTHPIPTQHTSPALQTVHLTRRGVQVTLLSLIHI